MTIAAPIVGLIDMGPIPTRHIAMHRLTLDLLPIGIGDVRMPARETAVTLKIALMIVAILVTTTSTCLAFGFTADQNPYAGPYYSNNPPDPGQRCVSQQQWVTDKKGHQTLKSVRVYRPPQHPTIAR